MNELEKKDLKQFGLLTTLMVAAPFSWAFVSNKPYNPSVDGHEAVVSIQSSMMTTQIGYDFNSDGILDYARADSGYGRGAGSVRISHAMDDFKTLQEKYTSQITRIRPRRL